jgi:hypothetical protein
MKQYPETQRNSFLMMDDLFPPSMAIPEGVNQITHVFNSTNTSVSTSVPVLKDNPTYIFKATPIKGSKTKISQPIAQKSNETIDALKIEKIVVQTNSPASKKSIPIEKKKHLNKTGVQPIAKVDEEEVVRSGCTEEFDHEIVSKELSTKEGPHSIQSEVYENASSIEIDEDLIKQETRKNIELFVNNLRKRECELSTPNSLINTNVESKEKTDIVASESKIEAYISKIMSEEAADIDDFVIEGIEDAEIIEDIGDGDNKEAEFIQDIGDGNSENAEAIDDSGVFENVQVIDDEGSGTGGYSILEMGLNNSTIQIKEESLSMSKIEQEYYNYLARNKPQSTGSDDEIPEEIAIEQEPEMICCMEFHSEKTLKHCNNEIKLQSIKFSNNLISLPRMASEQREKLQANTIAAAAESEILNDAVLKPWEDEHIISHNAPYISLADQDDINAGPLLDDDEWYFRSYLV